MSMSMGLLTLFQFLETLAAYLFVTLALPCAFLYKELSRYRFMDRVLLYFIIGNFYATNLVFLLQLLHISNFFTLWIGLLAVPAFIKERMNHFPILDRLRSFRHYAEKLFTGSLGIRSTADTLWRNAWRCCVRGLERAVSHWLDWLLVIALFLMVMWSFGIRMVQEFGYAASDIPVHLSWVNAMCENNIFMDGIYPHGMHAILYLINALFGIDIYVLFRVFAVVQSLTIHVMALLFLKLCCKSRFAAYTGVFLYSITNYFAGGLFWRFHSTLPQEYSMVYILPTAYYAILFFQEKRRELKEFEESEKPANSGESEGVYEFEEPEEPDISEELEGSGEAEASEKLEISEGLEGSEELEISEELEGSDESEGPKKGKRLRGSKRRPKSRRAKKAKKKVPEGSSRVALAGLIMSFSLCVTAHFYGAIVAALFCIGIAVGYAGWLARPVYLTRIVASGLISLVIAVLPMAIAFAMGTPLQGSLNWATNVIAGNSESQEEPVASVQEPSAPEVSAPEPSVQGPGPFEQSGGAQNAGAGTAGPSVEVQDKTPVVEKVLSTIRSRLLGPMKRFSVTFWNVTGEKVRYNIFVESGEDAQWCSLILRIMIIFLTVIGAVLLLTPARMYGAMLLSTGVFMILMALMLAGREVGVTALMDEGRSLIFFEYGIIIVVSFSVDACIWTVTTLFQGQWCRDVLSFAAVVVLGTFLWQHDVIRSPLTAAGLESNEAITCLTNIIATEPDYTWTILSANDETQMVYGHGYHYEPIIFLYGIERLSDYAVTMPTESVYFFIEKVAVPFWSPADQQPVSREGAMEPVPRGLGLDVYKGRNRWIVMSHMYYWAQEFQRLYPNEMKVYLETDRFICYRLEQNTYRLYDLAIDYGYNSVGLEEQ